MIEKRPHLWCLFDRRTSRVIEGLLFDEARAFISNLDAAEVENWFVWREEWPDWRPAGEIEGLTEMIYRALHVSPPPPPRGTEDQTAEKLKAEQKKAKKDNRPPALVTAPSIETKVDTSVSKIMRVATSESFPQQGAESYSIAPGEFVVRQQKRYKKRMAITIVGNDPGQIFKTYTRDISVGGMYLEESAPEWVKGYFKVRIAKPHSKQLIELNCGLIEEQAPDDRFRVAILPLQSLEDEKNLEAWLAA